MTRLQADNAINKIHDLIDRQGCVVIKATFDRSRYDDFEQNTSVDQRWCNVSFWGTNTVYVYIVILNESDIDLHNVAAYFLSDLIYFNAKKIEGI